MTTHHHEAVRQAARQVYELSWFLTGMLFGGVAALVQFSVSAGLVILASVLLFVSSAVAAMFLAVKSGAEAVWWASAAAVVAGWTSFARVNGLWHPVDGFALVIPAGVLSLGWMALAGHHWRLAEAERLRKEADQETAEQRKWPALLEKVGCKGVTYVSREDTLCGYLVHLRLPDSGRVTYKRLKNVTDELETAAQGMRPGSLRFEQPGDAHQVVLHVVTTDVLAEEIPMPYSERRLTISQPLSLGRYEDGRPCAEVFSGISTLIAGLTGSGKTNLINVIVSQLVRCEDVLVWMIDGKGGRAASPWLQPWLEGTSASPVLDWVAVDHAETKLMLEAALRAVRARARERAGGEKLRVGPAHPAILILFDEAAALLGQESGGARNSLEGVTNAQLAKLANELTLLARSEGINPVYAEQRATAYSGVPATTKSQCRLRIGLRVSTEAEARSLIPDDNDMVRAMARLKNDGTGVIRHKDQGGRVLAAKFFRLANEGDRNDIEPIARAAGNYQMRPKPDPVLLEALGEPYAQRWDRAAAWLPVRLPARAGGTVTAPPGVGEDEFRQIVAASLAELEQAADAGGSPARLRVRQIIEMAGAKGIYQAVILNQLNAEKLGVGNSTLYRWLKEDAGAGFIRQDLRAGPWKWNGGR